MVKRLVLIHGRAIKPAETPMKELARNAVLEGLRRAGMGEVAKKLKKGAIRFDLAYFGDISNAIQAAAKPSDRKVLTATDPDHGGAPCFPIEGLQSDFERVAKSSAFDKATYRAVLKAADDYRFLDEIADFASLIGTVFSFGVANELAIRAATPDFSAYLLEHDVGSRVRERLQAILQPALEAKEDICLVCHSMGAVVAYDLLWKLSHLSEYAAFRKKAGSVARFVTIGCPLGETAVRHRLLDGRYGENEKYPRNLIGEWRNLHAEDDYIAHIEEMAKAFKAMNKHGVKSIVDSHVYNCWSYVEKPSGRLVANPHDLYGYLMHQETGKLVGEWAA